MDAVDGVYYHGTDLRMVGMSREERENHKQDCMLVIDYLWQYFGSYYERDCMIKDLKEPLDYYEDNTLYGNLQDALGRNYARLHGNQLYQYDCFYMTSLKGNAKDYAWRAFAGGEMGLTAYRMIEGARQMKFEGMHPSNEIKSAINRIAAFAETPAQPVLFIFKDLDQNYLEQEDGSPIDWSRKHLQQNVRYTHPITLDIKGAIEVKMIERKELMKK